MLQKLLGTSITKVNSFVVYKSKEWLAIQGHVIFVSIHSRSSILKNECTLYWGAADELHFLVKISSSQKNDASTAKLKLQEPKVMPKYGKISVSCTVVLKL